ncbi:hypothetical protein [Gordonia sp. MMO-8]|uniref:hypothetical protein n=1 Tax=Gordonia sp. MMO-8 TaxID=3127886 RepID=UPI003017B6A5
MSGQDWTAEGEWELQCTVLLDGEPVAAVDVLGDTLDDAGYALDTLLNRADVDGLPEYVAAHAEAGEGRG